MGDFHSVTAADRENWRIRRRADFECRGDYGHAAFHRLIHGAGTQRYGTIRRLPCLEPHGTGAGHGVFAGRALRTPYSARTGTKICGVIAFRGSVRGRNADAAVDVALEWTGAHAARGLRDANGFERHALREGRRKGPRN